MSEPAAPRMTNACGAFSMRSLQAAAPEQTKLPWTSITSARPACTAAPQTSSVAGVVAAHGVTLNDALVAPVTVFPDASWIATWSAGAIAVPAAAAPGCTVNASFVATLDVPVGDEPAHAPSASAQAVKRRRDQKGPADATLGR